MTQVERVRRRMVDSLHGREIDRTAQLMNWDREAFIDLILLCHGDPRLVNQHWRAMLRDGRLQGTIGQPPRGTEAYRMLFDYIVAHEPRSEE